MASSLATAASASAAASLTKSSPSAALAPGLHHHRYDSLCKLSFPLSSKPKLKLRLFKGLHSSQSRSTSTIIRAEQNEVSSSPWFSLKDIISNFHSFLDTFLEPSIASKVAVGGSSNDAATPTKSEQLSSESRDCKTSNGPSSAANVSDESISEFITQVASLVRLVDSRDIVELQLKQLDCELLIRKKEALPQPPSAAPATMVNPYQQAAAPAPAVLPSPTAPAPASAPTPAPAPAKSAKSSVPPLKSPMAGTFYRSPAPGEPPFVKVGDKVQKGQVLCIIEAMKLMNDIEADQSGTIVEILAEDGKPVSVETPLFVIQP